MKLKRRAFLQQAAALFVGSAAAGSWPFTAIGQNKQPHLPAGKNGEAFWQAVQQQFTLKEGFAFLNNGTIGPSPLTVQNALIDGIEFVNSTCQYGGGDVAREGIAKLINAHRDEISLTHNTTEGLNILSWGLPLKKGDEILLTTHEHVGNTMPWLNRAKHDGIALKTFSPALTEDGILNQINDGIGRKTRVVSVPHISCTIGQRFPIKAIQQLCRDKQVFFVPDGAHGAGALHLDMQALDLDFYVSCGHKWLLGPKGTGFVYVKKDLLDTVKPVFAGAYTDAGYDLLSKPPELHGYNATAHRYDYGTKNAALYKALNAACEFMLHLDPTVVEKRILELNEYLRSQLLTLDDVELISSDELTSRSMMLGFVHKQLPYKTVATKSRRTGFKIRQVPESGLDSLRVSTHIYNSFEQINGFIEVLKNMKA